MSAKAPVTDKEGTAREAVLRAMQEASECVSGKKVLRHMTAAPCLPSLKKGPPSVCNSGGVSHASGAQRATAKHAVG